MPTLSANSLHLIARSLLERFVCRYNDELVALLGTGTEPNNYEALRAWLGARFADLELDDLTVPVQTLAQQTLSQLLESQYLTVAYAQAGPLRDCHPFLPLQALSPAEERRLARALYRLLLTYDDPQHVNGAIELCLDGEGDPVSRIQAWITARAPRYTHLPSELTLPLAQILMAHLRDSLEMTG